MRKIFILFLVFGFIYVLGSIHVSARECTKTKRPISQVRQHHRKNLEPTRFMKRNIGYNKVDGIDYKVIVDKKTRVQYIYIIDCGITGGVTPLLDSLGKPILYRGKLE